MANGTHFEGLEASQPMTCAVCDAMCMDAVDGTLSGPEMAAFDRHVAGCVRCAGELAEARRGAAWMEMLKGHVPAPPSDLLARILAETSGAEEARLAEVSAVWTTARAADVKPGWWAATKARFSLGGGEGFTAFQPRMAMTAAMAFFSIALTMNIGGVRLADLKPSALQRTISDTRANVTRSFQNSRVVYQMESRVNELRSDSLDKDDRNHLPERDPGGPFVDGNSSAKSSRQTAAQDGKSTPAN